MPKHLFSALLVSCAICGSATAQTQPTAAELDRSLAGIWVGALEYRDYQSNQMQKLPVKTRVSVAPDNATVTRLSTFDDGPKVGNVYITTVGLFDNAGAQLTSATFRKDRPVQTTTETAMVLNWRDAANWTVRYLQRGTDGGAVADIRTTQTLAADRLTTVKEVKPADQPDAAYVFRNQTVLTRRP